MSFFDRLFDRILTIIVDVVPLIKELKLTTVDDAYIKYPRVRLRFDDAIILYRWTGPCAYSSGRKGSHFFGGRDSFMTTQNLLRHKNTSKPFEFLFVYRSINR